MTEFNLLNCYNGDDETINFGTRAIADGDNLYESSTLATLQSSSPSELLPLINAKLHDKKTVFSIDNVLRIFEDVQCLELSADIPFDSIVDYFTFSTHLLFIFLRNGTVHILDTLDYSKFLATLKIENNLPTSQFFINAFVQSEGILSLLIITSKGVLYRLIFENAESKIEKIFEFKFSIDVAAFEYPTLFVSGAKMAIFDVETEFVMQEDGFKFKRVYPINHIFFAVDENGNLFRICGHTLLILPVDNNNRYLDTIVTKNSNRQQDHHLISVIINKDDTNVISVQNYQDLSLVYSIQIKSDVMLIEPESLDEELKFISFIYEERLLSEIRFMAIYETQSEKRLMKLLKKKQYQEAERFAKLYNLDPILIQKTKANVILDKIICSSEVVSELLQLLDSINDVEYKLYACDQAVSICETVDDVRRLYYYGCKITPENEFQIELVNDAEYPFYIFRLDTFYMLNKGTQKYTVENWMRFSTCNLIDELQFLLKTNQIVEATIIFTRFDNASIMKLNLENTQSILNYLNNFLSDPAYQCFLSNFIPIALNQLPDIFPIFLNWIYEKIAYFEKYQSAQFPKNAIEFAKSMVQYIKPKATLGSKTNFIITNQTCFNTLDVLSALDTLNELITKFDIRLPIKDIKAGPETVIRTLLNTNISPENYKLLVENFLFKYMICHHLNVDKIFFDEIVLMTNYHEQYWVSVIGVLLNCISKIEIRLEGVIHILESASVPWSFDIKKIANEAIQRDHPLANKIKDLILNEPVKTILKNNVYKIKINKIDTIENLNFAVKRILYCNDKQMVSHIWQLVKNKPANFKREVCIILAIYYIEKGDLEEALTVIDKNSNEDILKCCTFLTFVIETRMNFRTKNSQLDDLRKNYLEISNSIFDRLIQNTSDKWHKQKYQRQLDTIKSVYYVENNLQDLLQTNQISTERTKQQVIDALIATLIEKFKNNTITVDQMIVNLKTLTFGISSDFGNCLIQLSRNCDDFSVIYRVAQEIYSIDTTPRNMCLIIVLILKNLGYSNQPENECNETILDCTMVTFNPNTDQMFYRSLVLVYDIIRKMGPHVDSFMPILGWIHAIYYCVHFEPNKNSIADNCFYPGRPPALATFELIRTIFNSFVKFIAQFKLPHNECLTYFETKVSTEQNFLSEIKKISHLFENICEENHQITAYKLLQTLKLELRPLNLPALHHTIDSMLTKNCTPKLLAMMLARRQIDTDLLHLLLVTLDESDALRWLTASLRLHKLDLALFEPLLRAGLRYMRRTAAQRGFESLAANLVTIKWFRRPGARRLAYDRFFRAAPEQRLRDLVAIGGVRFEHVREFCADFRLDLQHAYAILFEAQFLDWRPKCVVETDEFGVRRITVQNDEKGIVAECKPFLAVMPSERVFLILKELWRKVNYYHYEVFSAMFEILRLLHSEQKPTDLVLLKFLITYKRVSKPSEHERQQWFKLFPESAAIDALSEFRLQFRSPEFIKEVFRDEITLKTYRAWMKISMSLGDNMEADSICSYAIKSLVNSGVFVKSETDAWCLYSKYNDVLVDIDECCGYISDVKLSISLIDFVINHMPPGLDLVNMAQLCFKYASLYNQQEGADSTVYESIKKKYFSISAKHILYEHQLTNEQYSNLLYHSSDLIVALFHDPRIIKKIDLENIFCPDINEAAEKLANLYNINLNEVKMKLINNIIEDNVVENRDFDLKSITTTWETETMEMKLKRATFICTSDNVERWQEYLTNFAMLDEKAEDRSFASRGNALRLLLMISDPAQIERLMPDIEYAPFLKLIEEMKILHNLQLLGIELTLQDFIEYDKSKMLKRLSKIKTNLSIETFAMICMADQILKTNYWSYIINKVISLGLFANLRDYLLFIPKMKFYKEVFYINAWQKLIDHSFNNLNLKNSNELDDILIDNFHLIQFCPIVFSIDFKFAFDRCILYRKFEFAAMFLQFIDEIKHSEFISIIRKSDFDVTKRLKAILAKGLAGVPNVIQFLE